LLKLQQALYWKPGYNTVYADPVSVIYLKQNDANKALNTNTAIQKPFSWPQAPVEPGWAAVLNTLLNPAYNNAEEDESKAPIYAGLFYNGMQDYPQAVKMLKPALPNLEDDPMALQTMATIYTSYGQVTKDPQMKLRRMDSAAIYAQQAAK
jgi:tetratricopeptide (TPR) repeat protein